MQRWLGHAPSFIILLYRYFHIKLLHFAPLCRKLCDVQKKSLPFSFVPVGIIRSHFFSFIVFVFVEECIHVHPLSERIQFFCGFAVLCQIAAVLHGWLFSLAGYKTAANGRPNFEPRTMCGEGKKCHTIRGTATIEGNQ